MRKSIYDRMLLISGVCLFGLSSPITASAQCVTPPTCSELGYTKSADECSGHTFLKCPFNTAVGYCDLGSQTTPVVQTCEEWLAANRSDVYLIRNAADFDAAIASSKNILALANDVSLTGSKNYELKNRKLVSESYFNDQYSSCLDNSQLNANGSTLGNGLFYAKISNATVSGSCAFYKGSQSSSGVTFANNGNYTIMEKVEITGIASECESSFIVGGKLVINTPCSSSISGHKYNITSTGYLSGKANSVYLAGALGIAAGGCFQASYSSYSAGPMSTSVSSVLKNNVTGIGMETSDFKRADGSNMLDVPCGIWSGY